MAIHINIGFLPGYIPYLHKQIVSGNGDFYRETPNTAFTKVFPLPIDKEYFPYLADVAEVWLVYDLKGRKR